MQQIYLDKSTFAAKIYTWMIVEVVALAHVLVRVCFNNCKEMTQFVNSLFQYAQRTKLYSFTWKRKFIDQVNLMFCLIAVPFNAIVPIILVIAPFLILRSNLLWLDTDCLGVSEMILGSLSNFVCLNC